MLQIHDITGANIRRGGAPIRPVRPDVEVKPPGGRPGDKTPDSPIAPPGDRTPTTPGDKVPPVRLGDKDKGNARPNQKDEEDGVAPVCRRAVGTGERASDAHQAGGAASLQKIREQNQPPRRNQDWDRRERENYVFEKDTKPAPVKDAFDSLGDDYMAKFGFKRDSRTWGYTEAKSKVPEVQKDGEGDPILDSNDNHIPVLQENGHPKFQDKPNESPILAMSHSRVEHEGKTYEAVVAHRRYAVEDKNRFEEDLLEMGEDPPVRKQQYRDNEALPVWELMNKGTPVCYSPLPDIANSSDANLYVLVGCIDLYFYELIPWKFAKLTFCTEEVSSP